MQDGEEEVGIEGSVVTIGVVVEEVGGEEVELGKCMEVGRELLEWGVIGFLPGAVEVGRDRGTSISSAGVGDIREEESRGEQGSSGCVGTTGAGEGFLKETSMRKKGSKGGEVSK